MKYLVIVIIAFLVFKIFSKKKKSYDWPDDQPVYLPEKKKPGCFVRIVKTAFFLVFAFFLVVFLNIADDSLSTVPTQTSVPAKTSATSARVSSASTAAPTATPTVEPTATPAPQTSEEWVQRNAEEVYGSDLISVTFQPVDNQKDMIVICCDFVDNFTNSLRRTYFMSDAKSMFKRISQLAADGRIEYGSCYIIARTTFLDSYGNEFDGNAMEIRLTADDISKINWSNITSDMLIGLATTYAVHPLFRD